MAGSQTHGFDMVIEISAQTIQNLIAATFDSGGFLDSLFPDLVVLEEFNLTFSLNPPPGTPASAVNPVFLDLDLVFAGGIQGSMEVVVGIDVNRGDADKDVVFMDFQNKLYQCNVSLTGIPIPGISGTNGLVGSKLKEHNLPLVPVPVERTATSTMKIIRADVKAVNDTSATDNDALAVTLTFGGGTAGNLNQFTSAFARAGAGAAVAVNFNWLCRFISPKIEQALSMNAGQFSNCSFSGRHALSDGVDLRSLSIAPADDRIRLRGSVSKSGTCYEATGTIGADIFVAIEAGRLKVSFDVADPDVDIDIPLLCWLAGAVIGALIGGIIFGVIGSIVGAIIVPLIIWIAESVIESTVENVAQQVTDAIGGFDADLQLVGVDSILDTAFIDDLTIGYDMYPREYWAIKSEGVVTMRSGDHLDIDTGVVKGMLFGGADLRLEGNGQSRGLRVLCGSKVAGFSNRMPFDKVRHFHLYGHDYGMTTFLPIDYFAYRIPIPFVDDVYLMTRRRIAIQTSDQSYGFFEVIDVTETTFKIKYKVYATYNYTLEIVGGFDCPKILAIPSKTKLESTLNYLPAATINAELMKSASITTSSKELTEKEGLVASNVSLDKYLRLANPQVQNQGSQILNYMKAAGNWYRQFAYVNRTGKATIRARINGFAEVNSFSWFVAGSALADQSSGTLMIQGNEFNYEVNGDLLTLGSDSAATIEFPVKVVVILATGEADSAIRCIKYKKYCKFTQREVPMFRDYQLRFFEEFGSVRLPAEYTLDSTRMVESLKGTLKATVLDRQIYPQ